MALRLYIDGVSRGNPGSTGVGVVLCDADEQVLRQIGSFLGELTDLEAVAKSLLIGLEIATAADTSELAVFSSSEWVVRQVLGQGRPPGGSLGMMVAQAQMLLLRFETWQINHLPTAENALAVALAEHAAQAGHDVETPAPETGSLTERTTEDRKVRVRVVEGSNTRICAEPCGVGEVFEFGQVAPAHMCLHALAAVLGEVMACKRDDPQVLGAVPVTKRCARSGCGAVFEIDLG